MRLVWTVAVAAFGAAAAACEPGNSPAGPNPSAGPLITIRNYTYLPARADVPPGGTVAVRNEDRVRHTLTSEAAPDALTPGVVAGLEAPLDTGLLPGAPPATTRGITVPATAIPGTVIPFYCREHAISAEQGVLVVTAP